MKLLKYSPLALMAVLAAGCSEAGPDPDAIDPGSFFPSYGETAYKKCAPNADEGIYDNTFNVEVCRTSNRVGETVGLAYSVKVYDEATDSYVAGSKDLFTVPEVFTYTTNEPRGFIPVVAHNELMEIHEPVLLTLQVLDDTSYGASSVEVEYQHVYPWESYTTAGTATVVDGWIMPLFGLDPFDYGFDCSYEVNDADPNVLRLVKPYQSSMYFEGLRSYNTAPIGGEYYIDIDLNNVDFPCVMPSISGFEMAPNVADWGMIAIANFEGYFLSQGFEYEDMEVELLPEERSTFKNNLLYIPSCVFFLNETTGPYSNGEPGQIKFPANLKIEKKANGKSVVSVASRSMSEINREAAVKFFGKKLNVKF